MLEPDAKGVGQINAVKAITRVLAHRVWSDQRRGWRYTNPNLEQLALLRAIYPKNRIWPVPVWRRIGHFQWDDPGSTAYRRSPHG